MSDGPGFGAFLKENAPFLAAGTAIAFTSSYGQTFFISLFADDVKAAFGLTNGSWGGLYAVATLASAIAMIWAGSLTDRFRVNRLFPFVALALVGACLLMAGARGWAMLVVAVFALRFFGQGMMTHLPAVAMARWFQANRGKALAISAMGFAIGQAGLPVVFVWLEPLFGWRWLWVLAAGLVLMSMPVIQMLLRQERTPQSIALDAPVPGMDGRHWTRAAMLRDPTFWAMVPLLLGPPTFGTALFFHQVHLTQVKGWALIDYVALMPLLTGMSVTMMALSGAALDRLGSSRLMMVYLLPFALGFWLMGEAQTLWAAGLALAVIGIAMGAQATLPTACWAELYGTRHLGAIKAMSLVVMVLGTAIGPGLTGALIDGGMPFPDQLAGIAAFLVAAQALAALGLARALPRLPSPA